MIKFLSLFIIVELTLCLYFTQNIPMQDFRKEHGWIRLSSMKLQEGICEIQTSMKFNSKKVQDHDYTLQIVLLNLEQFRREQQSHCSVFPSEENIFGVNLTLNKLGGFQVQQFVQEFEQDNTQRMIVVLRDCQSTLINQYFQSQAELQIVIVLTNEDSHLSFDHYFDILSVPFQIILVLRLISSAIHNKREDDINSSDLNQSILFLLYLHIISAGLFLISIICSIWFGITLKTTNFICLLINASVQVFICLLMLNLSFGWKINKKSQIFASQLIFKMILLIWWIVISYLSYDCRGNSNTNYFSFFIIVSKIILSLLILLGSLRNKNNHDHFSVEFYKKLILYSFIYLCSGYFQEAFLSFFQIQLKQVLEISLFCWRNTIVLELMSAMFINQHNLYQKVALSKKSFMD